MPITIGDTIFSSLKFKEEQLHPAKKEKPIPKWYGETQCNMCKATKSRFWYDAKTKHGYWAFMCEGCFFWHSLGRLGTGYGQKYDGESLEKVEG